MGPEWQAINTCMGKMKELVVVNRKIFWMSFPGFARVKGFRKLENQIERIYEFVYECPLLVKNAVDFINKADVRQEYRKAKVQTLFSFYILIYFLF